MPSRGVFLNRQWPVGYSFPACAACNASTRHEEKIVAMLSRLDPFKEPTPAEEAEAEKAMRAVFAAYPELAKQMIPSANEMRHALKRMELKRPDGVATKDLPIVKFPRGMVDALRVFGRKLALALHYKHSGRIVPKDAEVMVWLFTNAEHIAGKFPRQVLDIMPGVPALSRNAAPLQDQFFINMALQMTENWARIARRFVEHLRLLC